MSEVFDVLIIGGGPAGLSAAMSLGRMGKSALVCDDGRPRNAPAEHMNNFVSRDGLNPGEWRKSALRDLQKYQTIHFQSEKVLTVKKIDQHFLAQFESGQKTFRKVILAYGVQDQLPAVPGFKELWGKSVFHCPYCHGYEVRGTRLGLIANGKFLEHMLPMIYGLSKDTLIFTNEKSDLSNEAQEAIYKNKIRLVESKITSLNFNDTQLKSVVLANGEEIVRDGLFLAPKMPFQLKSQIGSDLGCEKTDFGFYKIDAFYKTTAHGVFAAGDIVSPMHSVLASAASGQVAGAAAVSEILHEDFLAR